MLTLAQVYLKTIYQLTSSSLMELDPEACAVGGVLALPLVSILQECSPTYCYCLALPAPAKYMLAYTFPLNVMLYSQLICMPIQVCVVL